MLIGRFMWCMGGSPDVLFGGGEIAIGKVDQKYRQILMINLWTASLQERNTCPY